MTNINPQTVREAEQAAKFWRGCTLTWIWVIVGTLLIIGGLHPVIILGIAITQLACSIWLQRHTAKVLAALRLQAQAKSEHFRTMNRPNLPPLPDLTPLARNIRDA